MGLFDINWRLMMDDWLMNYWFTLTVRECWTMNQCLNILLIVDSATVNKWFMIGDNSQQVYITNYIHDYLLNDPALQVNIPYREQMSMIRSLLTAIFTIWRGWSSPFEVHSGCAMRLLSHWCSPAATCGWPANNWWIHDSNQHFNW